MSVEKRRRAGGISPLRTLLMLTTTRSRKARLVAKSGLTPQPYGSGFFPRQRRVRPTRFAGTSFSRHPASARPGYLTMRRRKQATESDEEKNGSGPDLSPPSSDSEDYASGEGEHGKAAAGGEAGAAKSADKPKRTIVVKKRGGGAPVAANGSSTPPASPAPAAADGASPKQGRRAQQPRQTYKKKERNGVRVPRVLYCRGC